MGNSLFDERPTYSSSPSSRKQHLIWVFLFLLAIAWHLLLTLLPWERFFVLSPSLPPPVEIHEVDPQTLQAIRNQWKKKQLLLSQEKTPPDPHTPKPEDSRFLSDRNRRVEKQTRARQTSVIPKPSSQASSSIDQSTPLQTENLENLGVKFDLSSQNKTLALQSKVQKSASRNTQFGGDQAIDDPGIEEGDRNLLNSEQSIYYSFYARLYEQVGPLWESRIRSVPYSRIQSIPPIDYIAQVDVVLNTEGKLVAVHFIKRSGVKEFDEAILYAWNRIQHFPNPPQGLLNEKGEVHTGWTFTVQLSPKTGFQYLPPERVY